MHLGNEQIVSEYDAESIVVMLQGDNLPHLRSIPSESIDLIVTSPPYNIGKDYETVLPLELYIENQRDVIEQCVRVLKPTGNLCWQVGFTKDGKEIVPLDAIFYPVFKQFGLKLKNRIVWTFGHGMHAQKRFSGRHETILWFAKDLERSYFNLDAVRVPQKYPGKRHYRGPKKGEYSGHPDGKNPGDVWDIPNVKAHHIEKTIHQCQFPVGLVQRLIRALSPEGGSVLDPYSGSATTASAAIVEGRKSVSIELFPKYYEIGLQRAVMALSGQLKYRPIERPIQEPNPGNPDTRRAHGPGAES